jgi:penicillin-binding protein 2
VFHCWRKEGHGAVNLHRAIVESCDVYFYQLGNAIGINAIAKYAKLLGLGAKTGIELEEEKAGLMPTPEWKLKRYGSKWQRGETINTAIGQGYVLTTPLQIAAAFCGIATGSFVPKPRLVLKVKEGTETIAYAPEKRAISLSPGTVSFLKDALAGVVNDPRGTGSRARIEGIVVGGKTGTAQVVSSQKGVSSADAASGSNDHAWFVALAPVENPRIVVAVFIENGGHGGSVAAPLAQEVIKKILHLS